MRRMFWSECQNNNQSAWRKQMLRGAIAISPLIARAVGRGVVGDVTPLRKSICRQMKRQTCICTNYNDHALWPRPFVGIFKTLHPPAKLPSRLSCIATIPSCYEMIWTRFSANTMLRGCCHRRLTKVCFRDFENRPIFRGWVLFFL